mmetsp:Transcript_124616/g.219399  ORF Transcript_124616/g.219399 Transcript_124616/m.219399 type:complete len:260 (+) Transcript_124616:55-834(+)
MCMINIFLRSSLLGLAISLCTATTDSQLRFLGRVQERCAVVKCPADICQDGRHRRQIGESCCACPEEKCASAMCPADICKDGSSRRQIGENCCACPEEKCASAVCPADLCQDGSKRRQIGENCCACPGDTCALAACPKDICHDGSGRRQIGDNCCACPPMSNRSLGESCGPCFSPTGHCGNCREGLECQCVGLCADPFIADAPSTCVEIRTSTMTTTILSRCALAVCPTDICHDGSSRRQIGDNCCACPTVTNKSLGES